MAEIDIPSYFLCPISFQIMQDPVTLATGITYDRPSIEQWLFSSKKTSCPFTNQPLSDFTLTPNHTLRRLIQSWCLLNSANGIDRLPTPRSPVDDAYIAKVLDEDRPTCLQKLKSILLESDRNRHCVANSGAVVDFLSSVVVNSDDEGVDEAVDILNSLPISEQRLVELATRNEGEIVDSLTKLLPQDNAMILLKSIIFAIVPLGIMSFKEEIFVGIVKVLRERIKICAQSKKAALEALIGLCPCGRNRLKAVRAGAVHVLIDLLIEERERRITEMVLIVMDRLCGIADGRAEFVGHAAGLAAIAKKVLRVSGMASERAVRILYSVVKYSGTTRVVEEMAEHGVVSEMCLLLIGDCGLKTKEKLNEILRLHSRVWRRSPCLHPQLLALYPC